MLKLAARGLGNREIAEAMFLSPRTVEEHVASLLASPAHDGGPHLLCGGGGEDRAGHGGVEEARADHAGEGGLMAGSAAAYQGDDFLLLPLLLPLGGAGAAAGAEVDDLVGLVEGAGRVGEGDGL